MENAWVHTGPCRAVIELKAEEREELTRWSKARFEKGRIAGLEGRHKGSRVRKATPAVQARLLKKTSKSLEMAARTGRAGRWLQQLA